MSLNVTHTYVILDLSRAAFEEINSKLRAAGYDHCFHQDESRTVIDMHGIAVAEEPEPVGHSPFNTHEHDEKG